MVTSRSRSQGPSKTDYSRYPNDDIQLDYCGFKPELLDTIDRRSMADI